MNYLLKKMYVKEKKMQWWAIFIFSDFNWRLQLVLVGLHVVCGLWIGVKVINEIKQIFQSFYTHLKW